MKLRPADRNDVEAVKWALYAALAWSPDRLLPPFDAVMQHPEAERYHRDWGRPGDLGVIASLADSLVGVAYVDDETPEVAVAVREGHRGNGLGARLLSELAELARADGYARLSLSVDTANPARRLYERLGYREVGADEDGVRMVIELALPVPSHD